MKPAKNKPEPQGLPVLFDQIAPHTDSQDGSKLAVEMTATLWRYVVLPTYADVAIVLWIVAAWLADAFDVFPRLLLKSAVEKSGKSRTLDIIARLVPRALQCDSISAAALFRIVEKYFPTLLLDEMDGTARGDKDKAEAVRQIVNSGHARRGRAVRTNASTHKVEVFRTFAPVVLALIGDLWRTVEDRSVRIHMARRAPGERIEPLRIPQLVGIAKLAPCILRWAEDNRPHVLAAYDHAEELKLLPDGLDDRAADNWLPLFAVAHALGGDWPGRARAAALALSGPEAALVEEQSTGVQLLADIQNIFDGWSRSSISSSDLAKSLAELDDRPWSGWGKPSKPITTHAVARLLRAFRIQPVPQYDLGDEFRGYSREQFRDAWRRYLTVPGQIGIEEAAHGLQLSVGGEKQPQTANQGQNPPTTDSCSPALPSTTPALDLEPSGYPAIAKVALGQNVGVPDPNGDTRAPLTDRKAESSGDLGQLGVQSR